MNQTVFVDEQITKVSNIEDLHGVPLSPVYVTTFTLFVKIHAVKALATHAGFI